MKDSIAVGEHSILDVPVDGDKVKGIVGVEVGEETDELLEQEDSTCNLFFWDFLQYESWKKF